MPNSAALVVPGQGFIYIAPTGTAYPANPTAPASPWVEIGHTSYEEPFTMEREGGDKTILRTWEAPSGVRTRVEPVTYVSKFKLHQYDETSLKLYYGGGSTDTTTDRFEVPKVAVPQAHAMFVRVVDGANEWPRHFPSVEILGDDSEEINPEELSAMPVGATILDGGVGFDHLFTIEGPVI